MDGRASFWHAALLYSGAGEYLGAAEALAREPGRLYVAAPGKAMDRLRDAIRTPGQTFWADMTDVGRNPARIIPSVRTFATEHEGEVSCFLEPAWPSRTVAESREVARHEALCNLAFSEPGTGFPARMLCCYDSSALPDHVLGYAVATHPFLIDGGTMRPNPGYIGPGRFPSGADDPLPPPDPAAVSMEFTGRLDRVRQLVAEQAFAAGIGVARVTDFVIAVSELIANSYSHAHGGRVRVWCTTDEIICQVEDTGHITDPLAGSATLPDRGEWADHGYGLWLVNEVCDLVERRTGADGTTTRLHIWRYSR